MLLILNQIISKQFLCDASLNVTKSLELFPFCRQKDEITVHSLSGFQKNFIYNNTIQFFINVIPMCCYHIIEAGHTWL